MRTPVRDAVIKLSPIDDAFARWRGEAAHAKTPGKIEPEPDPDPIDAWPDDEPTLVDRKPPPRPA